MRCTLYSSYPIKLGSRGVTGYTTESLRLFFRLSLSPDDERCGWEEVGTGRLLDDDYSSVTDEVIKVSSSSSIIIIISEKLTDENLRGFVIIIVLMKYIIN